MSKEKQEEKEQKQTKVIKGRPRKEKRSGAKKLDLKKSAELFEEEFYVYWADPTEDLSEYEDEDGNVDIDSVPNEFLYEFLCRYVDPGTFLAIVNTPLAYDLPKDKDLTQKDAEEIIRTAVEDKLNNPRTEHDVRYDILQACVIEPEFESIEQIKRLLPYDLQLTLYEEITKGAIGENLVARFQKSDGE